MYCNCIVTLIRDRAQKSRAPLVKVVCKPMNVSAKEIITRVLKCVEMIENKRFKWLLFEFVRFTEL